MSPSSSADISAAAAKHFPLYTALLMSPQLSVGGWCLLPVLLCAAAKTAVVALAFVLILSIFAVVVNRSRKRPFPEPEFNTQHACHPVCVVPNPRPTDDDGTVEVRLSCRPLQCVSALANLVAEAMCGGQREIEDQESRQGQCASYDQPPIRAVQRCAVLADHRELELVRPHPPAAYVTEWISRRFSGLQQLINLRRSPEARTLDCRPLKSLVTPLAPCVVRIWRVASLEC